MATKTAFILILVMLASLVGGCHKPQPYVTDARLQRGLVIVLPGIEGRSPFNEAVCEGLNDGGVNCAIELYDWTLSGGLLYNLRATQRNSEKAQDIAQRVVRYRMSYPGRPVFLVGQSGGGAIAVWVAERLPDGFDIDGAILLAAAMSPTYPLDTALRNSKLGLVNFYSMRDAVLLGVGTTVAGTMDGEHTSSAGRVGFSTPSAGGVPPEYAKLFQIAWHEKMTGSGNIGLHFTSGAREFVAEYVAPFVQASPWDHQLLADVLNREWSPVPEPTAVLSVPPQNPPHRMWTAAPPLPPLKQD